jgi:NO-binding membrane sensor protein with MHYT domain
MVSETTSSLSLLVAILVGIGLMCYGMWLSSGQHINLPTIAGGFIVLAGIAAMLYVSVSVFRAQEHTTSH